MTTTTNMSIEILVNALKSLPKNQGFGYIHKATKTLVSMKEHVVQFLFRDGIPQKAKSRSKQKLSPFPLKCYHELQMPLLPKCQLI